MKKILVLLFMAILTIIAGAMAVNMRYPVKYLDIIEANTGELDASLVLAVILTESSFRENAESHRGAQGLMQLMPATAEETAALMRMGDFSPDNVWQPEVNIMIGCFYLNRLVGIFGNDELALAAYNAGQGNVNRWLANPEYSRDGTSLDVIPFPETENYLKRVRQNQRIYKIILFLTGRASK